MYASATDLSNGIPVDDITELTITSEDGTNSKTYKIMVVRQQTPEVYLMEFANPGNLGGKTVVRVTGSNLDNARKIRLKAIAEDCEIEAEAKANGPYGYTALLDVPANYSLHEDRVFTLRIFVDDVEQTDLDAAQKDMIQPRNNNQILSFTIPSGEEAVEIDDGDGEQSGTIEIALPYDANLTDLRPVIAVPAGTVVAPASGESVDLTRKVSYTVSTPGHADRTYQVRAEREEAPEITDLEFTPFQTSAAGALQVRVVGKHLDHMRRSIRITASAAGYDTVTAQAVRQEDGSYLATLHIPANTNPVQPVEWTLCPFVDGVEQPDAAETVTVPQYLAILSFEIEGQRSSTISGTEIRVKMPAGTDLTKLIPILTVTPGAQVSLPSHQAANFEEPVQVTVTMNGNTVTYTVIVRCQSSGGGGGSSTADETYKIEKPSRVRNGSLTVSDKKAEKGETITIRVKPDEGYELDELTVLDEDGDEIRLNDKGNGKFTFRMPGSDVSIEVSFRPVADAETPSDDVVDFPQEPVAAPVFTDVAAYDYFYDAVQWAVSAGITSGLTDTQFAPQAACTRAQMVTFLWRANGSPVVDYAMRFTDVSPDAYYAEAVRWAVSTGITAGVSATSFAPDAAVTRGQTVTFLYRAAGTPSVGGSNTFLDVPSHAFYADAVQWAVSKGVTAGMSAFAFGPQDVCTRGQIVTFLYRAR